MDRETKTWLYDILKAIEEIDLFFPEGEKYFEDYKKDLKTRRAVERNLEIIGEATNRIIIRNPDFTMANARKIIGLRNRIIHGYDVISDELIWGIIINDLPDLRSEIEQYL
jgi:uncharacterized protein with HEPN domain